MKQNIPYNIFNFLKTCSPKVRSLLYKCPIFSSGLLKSFDRTQQRFLFDLVIKAMPIAKIKNTKDNVSILKLFKDICIIHKQDRNILLDNLYRNSLLKGFCDINNILYLKRTEEAVELKSVIYDDILYMIVNKNLSAENISLKNILLYGEIIDTNAEITNRGFEFLLKTRNEQLWILLFVIIKYVCLKNNQSEEFEVSLISLVYEMSHKSFDFYYVTKTDDFSGFISMLSEVGLVSYCRKVFCVNSSFKNMFVEANLAEDRFLYIESNFKIYAYTESKFDICILDMFCLPVAVLPDMIAYRLTEDSVSMALAKKITAKQIVHYLKAKCRECSTNVLEMIEIWESRKKRILKQSGILLHNFMSLVDFNRIVTFAKNHKYLIEHFDNKRMIVVKEEGIDEIKEYIRQLQS